MCNVGQTAVVGSIIAADLHKKVPFDKSIGCLCPWPHHSKCFFKNSCSKWKCWSSIPIALFIGGRNGRIFYLFIFNFKCCQAHEGVKNWVEQYDRTNPLTSENWMWPKNLLLKQICFHELAVLFSWAGRADLIQAWLLARPWSQLSFVLWDSKF